MLCILDGFKILVFMHSVFMYALLAFLCIMDTSSWLGWFIYISLFPLVHLNEFEYLFDLVIYCIFD